MNKIVMDGVTIDIDAAVKQYKSLKASANLKERHAAIFEDKFGVNDGLIKTYDAVGRTFGISGDRARQLCGLVLYKIGMLKN